MSWRLDGAAAGSGALGDLGSHLVDIVQFLVGEQLTGVSATTETFIRERTTSEGRRAEVTVDDTAAFIARTASGVMATFEATRFATGRKNALRIDVNGSAGSVSFDLESFNELQLFLRDEPVDTQGFRRVLVTEPEHPYVSAWWPPGHVLGWEHTFVHQFRDFLSAIQAGDAPSPSFDDGLSVMRVLDAVMRSSAENSAWVPVPLPNRDKQIMESACHPGSAVLDSST
jgi:predicted dehydrogenase